MLAVALVLSACASDAVEPPAPEIDTPGAFIAQQLSPGDVRLMRTLGAIQLSNGQEMLFVTLYEPHVASFAAARELAKEQSIPIKQAISQAIESELTKQPWEVVWFRTLTPDERDALQ